jgi:hypothetical protein
MCVYVGAREQMRIHLSSKHGIKNPVRKKMSGSVCFGCMRDFETRSRCLRHVLYRVKACENYIFWNVQDLEEDVLVRVEAQTNRDDAA